MKSKKMMIILVVFLSATVFLFTGTAVSSDVWKKGRVTGISDNYLKIDGRGYNVNPLVVITDYDNNLLAPELSALRAVNKIIYKTKDGEITEIRIIERKH